MANIQCPNGHHYNPEDNPTCPYCEQERTYEWPSADSSGSTEPVSGFRGFGGGTVVMNPTEGYFGRKAASGGTVVINSPGGNPGGTSGGGTEPIDSWRNRPPAGSDESRTTPAWDKKEYQHQPVVGWLVCIEGPDKGKDFSLHGAKSSIGRRNDSSICLTDPKISRDGFPALIVYDDRKTHKFYLASGDASARNNVELGGNMLLGQSVINPYDEIRIEDTVLVFVPFCSDDFYWDEKKNDQVR